MAALGAARSWRSGRSPGGRATGARPAGLPGQARRLRRRRSTAAPRLPLDPAVHRRADRDPAAGRDVLGRAAGLARVRGRHAPAGLDAVDQPAALDHHQDRRSSSPCLAIAAGALGLLATWALDPLTSPSAAGTTAPGTTPRASSRSPACCSRSRSASRPAPLIRRTIPAMAVTLVVYAAARIPIHWFRGHFAPSTVRTLEVPLAAFTRNPAGDRLDRSAASSRRAAGWKTPRSPTRPGMRSRPSTATCVIRPFCSDVNLIARPGGREPMSHDLTNPAPAAGGRQCGRHRRVSFQPAAHSWYVQTVESFFFALLRPRWRRWRSSRFPGAGCSDVTHLHPGATHGRSAAAPDQANLEPCHSRLPPRLDPRPARPSSTAREPLRPMSIILRSVSRPLSVQLPARHPDRRVSSLLIVGLTASVWRSA